MRLPAHLAFSTFASPSMIILNCWRFDRGTSFIALDGVTIASRSFLLWTEWGTFYRITMASCLTTQNNFFPFHTYLSAAVVLIHRLIVSFISVSVTFSNASGRIPCNIQKQSRKQVWTIYYLHHYIMFTQNKKGAATDKWLRQSTWATPFQFTLRESLDIMQLKAILL